MELEKTNEPDFSDRISIINEFSQEDKIRLKVYFQALFKNQGLNQQNADFAYFVKNPKFFNILGDFCQRNQYYKKAVQYYKKALDIDPRNYWANFHIANIYSKYIYSNKASELDKKRHTLIDEIINIYDYLIAITFKNKANLNQKEEYCLRSASYFFEYIGKYSRAILLKRLLAESGRLISVDKYTYKPINPLDNHPGVQMNSFYEKFALVLEDRTIVNNYRHQYAEKKHKLNPYLIAITPRSGSSWLTELIYKTQLAGNPEEWFNQENLDGILALYPCGSLQDYLKCIKVAQSTSNNVFGLEASFFQLKPVLETMSLEQIFCPNFKSIYLTRNDFIKQGISLYKAVTSTYYHANQDIKEVKNVDYDSSKIKYWILHILHQEFFWEKLFKKNRLQPLRITYEKLVENPELCVKDILSHIGVKQATINVPVQTEHKKISNHKSKEMYEKFQQENKDFIESCKQLRNTKNILEIKVI